MLPLRHRLKSDADFERVFALKQKQLVGPLLIFTAPSQSETTRFGIVVSKKVSKKAVERNKIRRQLAVLLRPIAEAATACQDIVILVLRLADYPTYQQALATWQKKR